MGGVRRHATLFAANNVGCQAPVPRSFEDTRFSPRTDVPSQTDVGMEHLAKRVAIRAQHRLRGHSRAPAPGASGSVCC